jgi:ribulose kinase
MNSSGYRIDTMFVTGGGTKNPLWLQEHADATGLSLVLPQEPEAVLLGAAILAANAAGIYGCVPDAMKAMSHSGTVVKPNPATAAYHSAKFSIYREMYQEQVKRRNLMSQF